MRTVLGLLRRFAPLLLATLLTACGTAHGSTDTLAPASPQPPESTPTRTATATPTQTLTATSSPTSTPLPTSTFTLTPTPQPTATPTRRPTLTPRPSPSGDERTTFAPILAYHHIAEPPEGGNDSEDDYYVSPANFDEQLRYLSESGYQPVSLYDLNDYLQTGKALPDRPVILTFDDGYIDNFTVALPLLSKYGFTATFFLVTGPIDGKFPGYVTWAQVEQMSQRGMDIESHTRSHANLRGQPEDQVYREIAGAKEEVEEHTGRPCRFLSYPFGVYDEQVVSIVRQLGFWGAVTLDHGTTVTSDDMFTLPRVWVRRRDTLDTFIQKLERGW